MTFLIRSKLVILIVLFVDLAATSKDKDVSVTTGRLYAVDTTGTLRSFHKRDVQAMNENERQHIRLSLDDESLPIDMHLQQGSVWDKDSVFVIRRGDRTFNSPQFIDNGCHIHGHVISHGGGANFNRCGRMTGNIHVPGHHYELEEISHPEHGHEEHHSQFKVTKRISGQEVIGSREMDFLHNVGKREIFEPETEQNSTSREKRRTRRMVIELAVFVDKAYGDHLFYEENLDSEDELQAWFIRKWNTVQGVYSDPEVVGARVKIALKKIDLWIANPSTYPSSDVLLRPRMDWFCENTPSANRFDMKVLYTKNVAGTEPGMSNLGGVCNPRYKCFIINTDISGVKRELYEMGRNLGFPRDSEFGDCEGQGFMGSTNTYTFLPCYRRRLQSIIREGNKNCLRRRNIEAPVVTIATPTETTVDFRAGC